MSHNKGVRGNWRERAGTGPVTAGLPHLISQRPRQHQSFAAASRQQAYTSRSRPLPSHASGLNPQATRKNAFQCQGLMTLDEDEARNPSGKSKAVAASPTGLQQSVCSHDIRAVVLQKYEFKRGLILNAPIHTQDSKPNKSVSTSKSNARSMTAYGPVFSVPRYMIVVSLHEVTYMAIPLFTHEYKGLLGKEHYSHEFVSVRDGRIPTHNFNALSRYQPLVTNGKGPSIHKLSTAHFAYPVTRNYDMPMSVCGELTPESAARLVDLVREEMNRGLGYTKDER